jgi:hypothetical protein
MVEQLLVGDHELHTAGRARAAWCNGNAVGGERATIEDE